MQNKNLVIIDYKQLGNVVRFYLGKKTPKWGWTNHNYKDYDGKTPRWLRPSNTYFGDDWDDTPYEQNAGYVYKWFVKGYCDIAFNADDVVVEPCHSASFHSSYSKQDMVDKKIPCIIAVPNKVIDNDEYESFDYWNNRNDVKKYYFGDEVSLPEDCLGYKFTIF